MKTALLSLWVCLRDLTERIFNTFIAASFASRHIGFSHAVWTQKNRNRNKQLRL